MQDQLAQKTVDIIVSDVASKTTAGGAGASIAGWLTNSEIVAAVGLLVAILGLVVNFIFKYRADKRHAELHRRQMELVNQAAVRVLPEETEEP